MPPKGVAFTSAIDDPYRFRDSRAVSASFGLTPSRHQSGTMDHAGRISRAGDQVQRSLLFAAAQCLALRSSGQAPTLAARFEALAARTGRKQALVALARKRAVLMHGLQHFQAGWKQPAARNMRQRKGLERLA